MELLLIKQIALWIHLLCMVGCFGMVLAAHIASRAHTRETLATDKTLSTAAMALGLGLVAGIAVFLLKAKLATELSSAFMMIITIKLLLLVAAGGSLAMASKKAREGDADAGKVGRLVALASIAIAALLGVLLSPGA